MQDSLDSGQPPQPETTHDQAQGMLALAKRLRMRATRQPDLMPEQRRAGRAMASRLEAAVASSLLKMSSPPNQAPRQPGLGRQRNPDGIPSQAPQAPAPTLRGPRSQPGSGGARKMEKTAPT